MSPLFSYHICKNERLAREYRQMAPITGGSAAIGGIPLATIFTIETANAFHHAMTSDKSLEMRMHQENAVTCGTITTIALAAVLGPAVIMKHLSRFYSNRAADAR